MIGSIIKRFVLLLSVYFIGGDSVFWDFSVGDICRTFLVIVVKGEEIEKF